MSGVKWGVGYEDLLSITDQIKALAVQLDDLRRYAQPIKHKDLSGDAETTLREFVCRHIDSYEGRQYAWQSELLDLNTDAPIARVTSPRKTTTFTIHRGVRIPDGCGVYPDTLNLAVVYEMGVREPGHRFSVIDICHYSSLSPRFMDRLKDSE